MIEPLIDRHSEYLMSVPMEHTRELMEKIDWESPLLLIRGPKGVGKSTLMKQYILRHYATDDSHVLYCSADTSFFSRHSLVETASDFVRRGGKHLFIDEIHRYRAWSSEIKEIYDLYPGLRMVLSGSSLIQLNDGQADLSRRVDVYDLPGLSFREYLWFMTGQTFSPVTLADILESPSRLCNEIRSRVRPLGYFSDYLRCGYYPFSFERKKTYRTLIENVVNYILDTELTQYRGVDPANIRKIKSLMCIIASMVPYQVDISKLSRNISIDRVSLLRYIRYLDEAKLTMNLYAETDHLSDLQKPDKLFLDNPNLFHVFCAKEPEIGTVRECFFCNQLISAGHTVEYSGNRTGDFRIDHGTVIEVGGENKDFSQISDEDIDKGALAVDGIDTASSKKIPLWLFGFLY